LAAVAVKCEQDMTQSNLVYKTKLRAVGEYHYLNADDEDYERGVVKKSSETGLTVRRTDYRDER